MSVGSATTRPRDNASTVTRARSPAPKDAPGRCRPPVRTVPANEHAWPNRPAPGLATSDPLPIPTATVGDNKRTKTHPTVVKVRAAGVESVAQINTPQLRCYPCGPGDTESHDGPAIPDAGPGFRGPRAEEPGCRLPRRRRQKYAPRHPTNAETVRWIEWAAAGYFRITLGISPPATDRPESPDPPLISSSLVRNVLGHRAFRPLAG